MNNLTDVEILGKVTEWIDEVISSCNIKNENAVMIHLYYTILFTDNEMTNQASALLTEDLRNEFYNRKSMILYRITEKRAEYLNLNLTDEVITIISFMSTTPAEAVMQLTILKHFSVSKEKEVRIIDFNYYISIFDKYFSRDDYARLWNKQKYEGLNLIDMINPNKFIIY